MQLVWPVPLFLSREYHRQFYIHNVIISQQNGRKLTTSCLNLNVELISIRVLKRGFDLRPISNRTLNFGRQERATRFNGKKSTVNCLILGVRVGREE